MTLTRKTKARHEPGFFCSSRGSAELLFAQTSIALLLNLNTLVDSG